MADALQGKAGAEAPADLVELGRIVDAYGIRGWVKVQPHTARSETLLAAKRWWLAAPVTPAAAGAASAAARVLRVKDSRTQGSTIVASLEGVPGRNEAEALKGQRVLISRSDFPATEDGEYYWVDLMGCQVWGLDDNGSHAVLGAVVDVIDNGAHSVLSVGHQQEQDGKWVAVLDEKGRQVTSLVPFVDAHLHEVDLPGRRIVTNWPLDF